MVAFAICHEFADTATYNTKQHIWVDGMKHTQGQADSSELILYDRRISQNILRHDHCITLTRDDVGKMLGWQK